MKVDTKVRTTVNEGMAMIRPTTPEETPLLVTLTEATGLFKPLEVEALVEVFADYFGGNWDFGHRSVTAEQDGLVTGFAYYAPAAMTDRTWYLYWIAVRKDVQARGVGSALLRFVENDIREQHHGRVLFIETGSLPHYELTRRFYVKNNYEKHALLKDYYAVGDSMVVFRKALVENAPVSPLAGETPLPQSDPTSRSSNAPGKRSPPHP